MSEYISENLKQQIRSHFADCCADCRIENNLGLVTFGQMEKT